MTYPTLTVHDQPGSGNLKLPNYCCAAGNNYCLHTVHIPVHKSMVERGVDDREYLGRICKKSFTVQSQ
jgi:hypothetical protein